MSSTENITPTPTPKDQAEAPEAANKTTNPDSSSHLTESPNAPTENASRMVKPTGK